MSQETFVWPTFKYDDARAAIRFLVDAFGFEETASYPGETEEIVAHAELRWPPGGGVMLGSVGAGDDRFTTSTASTYVVCDDPDALHDRAAAAGAEIVRGLVNEDYGSREFTARDPEGNLWTFGTYRGQ